MSSTARLPSLRAAASITVRSALAVRPPRPMTRPRSSGSTVSSNTVERSRSRTSTWTASFRSTSSRASQRTRSRTVRLALLLGGLLRLRLLEQHRHGLAGLRARLEPVLDPIRLELQELGPPRRVVHPDVLDVPAVARLARVGRHHVIEGRLVRARARQPKNHRHEFCLLNSRIADGFPGTRTTGSPRKVGFLTPT